MHVAILRLGSKAVRELNVIPSIKYHVLGCDPV
jgi:hypothetical protein